MRLIDVYFFCSFTQKKKKNENLVSLCNAQDRRLFWKITKLLILSFHHQLSGDVDGCAVQPISQSQFTPLPEALCWVIWELNLAERSTALDDVTAALGKTSLTQH